MIYDRAFLPIETFIFDGTTFKDEDIICITGYDWVDHYHTDLISEIISIMYKSVVLLSTNKDFLWIPVEKIETIRFATNIERILWILLTEDNNVKKKKKV